MTNSTAAGTIGGTLLSIVAIPSSTVITTVIIACIGATVSFFMSILLKAVWLYFTKNKEKKKK
jgi:hypothetical protein